MRHLFIIVTGSLLLLTSIVQADQVILDDLIVDGSICAGMDGVNGESFGFDTLRLKENNLRIKAQDTSSTSSFPSRDWQITFNDSSNGGQNKFSIDDIDGGRTPFTIEAGAPSNSLYVDDGGRLGIGTSTPVVNMHVVTGNSPTLRLEQNGSSGFTPQTWDVAGNEANFFIRDATNGSTLPFRIRTGAPSSSIDISASGNVGMGTDSPSDEDGLAERFIDVKASGSGDARVVADAGSGGFSEFLLQENNVNHWSLGHAGQGDDRFYIFNYMTNRSDFSIDPASGVVSIPNGLTVTGGCSGCDAVFQSHWPLESIEDHANYMFENSHLAGVGATPEGEVTIDIFKKTTGLLQELEKAHIYISQLNNTIKALEGRVNALEIRKLRSDTE